MTTEDLLKSAADTEDGLRQLLKAHQLGLFDQPHHVAYDRTTASGKTVHVEAKDPRTKPGKVVHEGYSWGRLTKVQGKGISAILHPEHQDVVGNLKDGESAEFKDEQNVKWTATRSGKDIHFHPPASHATTGLKAKRSDLFPSAAPTTAGNETYWRGDKGRYTGKTEQLHGATFYQIELLEGHRKGEKVLTRKGHGTTPSSETIDRHKLQANIEKLAAEQGIATTDGKIAMISQLQTGATVAGKENLIGILGAIKGRYMRQAEKEKAGAPPLPEAASDPAPAKDWDHHGVEAAGRRGMKNAQWRKTFKNAEAMSKWADENGATVDYSRGLEAGEQHPHSRGAKGERPGGSNRASAKEMKGILESPDFGMTESGGNGRVKTNADGTLTVMDGFHFGSREALERLRRNWEPGGSHEKYFADEHGLHVEIVGEDIEHRSKVFRNNGHVALHLKVTKGTAVQKSLAESAEETEAMLKSHVKEYTRTSASGATVQVKEHEDGRKTSIKDLKKHPMWSESDHAYFKGKGYTNEEVKAIWDRDHKDGKGPVTHEKAPDVVGYLNQGHYKQVGVIAPKKHDEKKALASAMEHSRTAFASDKYADHQKALDAHKAAAEKATDPAVKEKHKNYITMHTAESHVAKDKPK